MLLIFTTNGNGLQSLYNSILDDMQNVSLDMFLLSLFRIGGKRIVQQSNWHGMVALIYMYNIPFHEHTHTHTHVLYVKSFNFKLKFVWVLVGALMRECVCKSLIRPTHVRCVLRTHCVHKSNKHVRKVATAKSKCHDHFNAEQLHTMGSSRCKQLTQMETSWTWFLCRCDANHLDAVASCVLLLLCMKNPKNEPTYVYLVCT